MLGKAIWSIPRVNGLWAWSLTQGKHVLWEPLRLVIVVKSLWRSKHSASFLPELCASRAFSSTESWTPQVYDRCLYQFIGDPVTEITWGNPPPFWLSIISPTERRSPSCLKCNEQACRQNINPAPISQDFISPSHGLRICRKRVILQTRN